MTQATVAVVKHGDPYELMEHALNLINADEHVRPGLRVFIKPNLVRVPLNSPYAKVKGAYVKTMAPEGDVIRRDTLEALLKVLNKWGIKDITIGEASGGCETTVAYKALALYELAEEYGANLIDLNYADSVKVPVPNKLILDYIWVPKVLQESDLLIDLTTLKVHGRTAVTLCLKNWGLGILPGKYYGFDKSGYFFKGLDKPLPIHKRGEKMVLGQELTVSQVIADVCSTLRPHLGIIDGLTVIHYAKLGNKVFAEMKVERTNLMLASFDLVAVDAVASRIVSLDPEKILHIKFAAEKGLGVLDPSNIEVKGVPIKDVQIRCTPLLTQKELIL